MPEIRTVKTIVLGMTALIALMIGVLLWGLTRNSADSPMPARAASAAPWEYHLPEGSRIVSVGAAGSFLALTLDSAEGQRVLVIDPKDSSLRGTIIAPKSP